MIILDTSVLIGWAESSDAHHTLALEQLRAYAGHELLVSPISLAEFYVWPARRGKLDVALQQVEALGLRTVPLPDDAPVRLAELRSLTGLKMPDCCVLLAAAQTGAAVLTFDTQLREATPVAGVQTA